MAGRLEIRAAPVGRVVAAAAVVVVASLLAATAAAAPAATPSGYRAALNRMCRSYTPMLRKLEAEMAAAQKRKDAHSYGIYLGEALVLALQEDGRIERAAVPQALHATMAPIIRTLKTADAHLRAAVSDALRSDPKGMLAEFTRVAALAPTLNRSLDRAGLRDCGSNQR